MNPLIYQMNAAARAARCRMLVAGTLCFLVGSSALVCLFTGCLAPNDPALGPRRIAPYLAKTDTTSMLPAIKPGEPYYVFPTTLEEVRPGEIVSAYHPALQVHVVHRVIAVRHDAAGRVVGLVTKGDNNPERDAWITTAAELVGRVML